MLNSWRSKQRNGLLLALTCGAAIVALAAGYIGVIQGDTNAASGPKLQIKHPNNASVGEPIQFEIRIVNALDVAGYEASLHYDESRAIFRGVSHEDKSLDRLAGIDPQPLGPIVTTNTAVFGLFTCPVAVCSDAQSGPRSEHGGRGNIHLATFEFVPTVPGDLVVSFNSLKFVDFFGEQVLIEIPSREIKVNVRD